MEKRSYSVVLPAALIYFVLLGFADGQFFPGKVFIVIILVRVFEIGFIFMLCSFARKRKKRVHGARMCLQINWRCLTVETQFTLF